MTREGPGAGEQMEQRPMEPGPESRVPEPRAPEPEPEPDGGGNVKHGQGVDELPEVLLPEPMQEPVPSLHSDPVAAAADLPSTEAFWEFEFCGNWKRMEDSQQVEAAFRGGRGEYRTPKEQVFVRRTDFTTMLQHNQKTKRARRVRRIHGGRVMARTDVPFAAQATQAARVSPTRSIAKHCAGQMERKDQLHIFGLVFDGDSFIRRATDVRPPDGYVFDFRRNFYDCEAICTILEPFETAADQVARLVAAFRTTVPKEVLEGLCTSWGVRSDAAKTFEALNARFGPPASPLVFGPVFVPEHSANTFRQQNVQQLRGKIVFTQRGSQRTSIDMQIELIAACEPLAIVVVGFKGTDLETPLKDQRVFKEKFKHGSCPVVGLECTATNMEPISSKMQAFLEFMGQRTSDSSAKRVYTVDALEFACACSVFSGVPTRATAGTEVITYRGLELYQYGEVRISLGAEDECKWSFAVEGASTVEMKAAFDSNRAAFMKAAFDFARRNAKTIWHDTKTNNLDLRCGGFAQGKPGDRRQNQQRTIDEVIDDRSDGHLILQFQNMNWSGWAKIDVTVEISRGFQQADAADEQAASANDNIDDGSATLTQVSSHAARPAEDDQLAFGGMVFSGQDLLLRRKVTDFISQREYGRTFRKAEVIATEPLDLQDTGCALQNGPTLFGRIAVTMHSGQCTISRRPRLKAILDAGAVAIVLVNFEDARDPLTEETLFNDLSSLADQDAMIPIFALDLAAAQRIDWHMRIRACIENSTALPATLRLTQPATNMVHVGMRRASFDECLKLSLAQTSGNLEPPDLSWTATACISVKAGEVVTWHLQSSSPDGARAALPGALWPRVKFAARRECIAAACGTFPGSRELVEDCPVPNYANLRTCCATAPEVGRLYMCFRMTCVEYARLADGEFQLHLSIQPTDMPEPASEHEPEHEHAPGLGSGTYPMAEFDELAERLSQCTSSEDFGQSLEKLDPLLLPVPFSLETRAAVTPIHRFLSDEQPWQVQFGQEGQHPTQWVVKPGADLRTDQVVLGMFEFFNSIWRDANVVDPIPGSQKTVPLQTKVYQICRVRDGVDSCGFVEFLPDFRPIDELKGAAKRTDSAWKNTDSLVSSAAAAFVSAYALNVRDRQHNNMGRMKGNLIVNLNVGWMIGGPERRSKCMSGALDGVLDGTRPLAGRQFPLPQGLRQNLEKSGNWDRFCQLCTVATKALSRRQSDVKRRFQQLLQLHDLDCDHVLYHDVAKNICLRLERAQDPWEMREMLQPEPKHRHPEPWHECVVGQWVCLAAVAPAAEPEPEPATEKEFANGKPGIMVCDYRPTFDHAIPAKCGDGVLVLSTENSDWWKVKIAEAVGFVPASMVNCVGEPSPEPEEGHSATPVLWRYPSDDYDKIVSAFGEREDPFDVALDVQLPFAGEAMRSTHARLHRTFSSATRPKELHFSRGAGGTDVKVVLKKGDDLRQDQAIIAMLEKFNQIWREEAVVHTTAGGKRISVEHPTYPVAVNGGAIYDGGLVGMLADFRSTSRVEFEKKEALAWKISAELIPSAVATFVAAFVLTIRDRHKDNFGLTGRRLANIDFGWVGEGPGREVLGARVGDALSFNVPKGLRQLLMNCRGWAAFRQLCWEAISALGRRQDDIQRCWEAVIEGTEQNSDTDFRVGKLDAMLNRETGTLNITQKTLWALVDGNPDSWQTYLKNSTHYGKQNYAMVRAVANVFK